MSDNRTLGEILGEAEPQADQSAHDRMADQIRTIYPPVRPDETCLLYFDNSELEVSNWMRNAAYRQLGFRPRWVRIAKSNLGRGALFVIHNEHADGEAELVVVAQRNVMTRHVLREVAIWAFQILKLNRLTVRIPSDRADLSEMARKAGFHHEGTARRFFAGAINAEVWAMCGAECKWLPKLAPLIPPDVSPPFSNRMH